MWRTCDLHVVLAFKSAADLLPAYMVRSDGPCATEYLVKHATFSSERLVRILLAKYFAGCRLQRSAVMCRGVVQDTSVQSHRLSQAIP